MASRKRKNVSKEFIDDSDEEGDGSCQRQPEKKTRPPSDSKSRPSASDDELIPLSNTRFVSVRSFKGRIIVDIREYYEDSYSGQSKPGKKGIALSVDQWNKLKQAIPQIDSKIQEDQ